MDSVYKKLRIYNIVMGVLHLVQGIFMLALSNDSALIITRNTVSNK